MFLAQNSEAIAQKEIPWNNDILFERMSVDEDITAILNTITRLSGLKVEYRTSVEGTVTHRFSHVPFIGVFNMIVEQNDLAYDYDDNRKTIIFRASGKAGAVAELTRGKSNEVAKKKNTPSARIDKPHTGKEYTAKKIALAKEKKDTKKKIAQAMRRIQRNEHTVERIAIQARQLENLGQIKQDKLMADLRVQDLQRNGATDAELFGAVKSAAFQASRLEVARKRLRAELSAFDDRINRKESQKTHDNKPTMEAKSKSVIKSMAPNDAISPDSSSPRKKRGVGEAHKPVIKENTPTPFNAVAAKPVARPKVMIGQGQPKQNLKIQDLSERYKLSGIGKFRGKRYATIDGEDFGKGDEFKGFVIVEIAKTYVELVGKKHSNLRFKIQFRRK